MMARMMKVMRRVELLAEARGEVAKVRSLVAYIYCTFYYTISF